MTEDSTTAQIVKSTSYFKSRRIKVYMPLDEGADFPEGFEVEGHSHPHLVLRLAKTKDAMVARSLATELPEDYKNFVALTVLVRGIGGDWDLYVGEFDGSWDWPKLTGVDAARARIDSIFQLDELDVIQLMEEAQALSTLGARTAKN